MTEDETQPKPQDGDAEGTEPQLVKTKTKRFGSPKNRRATPESKLIDARKRLHLAYAAAFVSLVFAVILQYLTISAANTKQRVLVLDSQDTFYSSPMDYLRNDSPVFERVALMAAEVILKRNPNGLAMPELANYIMVPAAMTKLQGEVAEVVEDYKVRQLRQMPEVEVIQALRSQKGNRIMRVSGKLIRTGNFQGMAIYEPWGFDMVIGIRPNPNMLLSGEFPFVIVDYRIRYRQ